MGFQWGLAGGIFNFDTIDFGKSFIDFMTVAEDVRKEAKNLICYGFNTTHGSSILDIRWYFQEPWKLKN